MRSLTALLLKWGSRIRRGRSLHLAQADDGPVARHNREEEILFVWGGLTLVLLVICFEVWKA